MLMQSQCSSPAHKLWSYLHKENLLGNSNDTDCKNAPQYFIYGILSTVGGSVGQDADTTTN